MNKSEIITIKVSPEEKEQIQKKATKEKLKLSTFCRWVLLKN